MTTHPEREALERYLLGGLAPEEVRWIETHLRTERCVTCLFLARELMADAEPAIQQNIWRFVHIELYPEEERGGSLEAAWRIADRWGSVIAAERELVPELVAELEGRSPAARRRAIGTMPRYQLFALSEHLIEKSQKESFRDVALALEWAKVAVVVSDALDPRIYMAATTADQRALARACLGNVLRIGSDLYAAEDAFQQSLLHLKEGNKTSPIPADVWSLLGSLRIDQERYAEARNVLEEALKAYRKFRLKRDEAKVLVKLANTEGYAGNPERAVEILLQAEAALGNLDEERLHLQAQHNLTDWMLEAGQAMDALARYEKARALYDRYCTEPSLQLRRRWLEGRIYAALGELDLARDTLEEVRAVALERELSYEVAMVSLDLAIVYFNRGEAGRVRALAEEMMPIFRSRKLHRHALAAMYLFQTARAPRRPR